MSSNTQHVVEIWHIPGTLDQPVVDHLTTQLSPSEQQRAQRLPDGSNRNTYITSHAAMRMILANHLHLSPESIDYSYNSFGKPQLVNYPDLFFNLSHTHAYALLALSPACQVGIDIEIVKPARDVLAIAKRFFSDNEYHWLSEADPLQRNALFYQLWCHKEACLKAIGQGLHGGLATFSLNRQDLQHETPITDRQHKQWWLQEIEVPEPYRAALATDGPNLKPATRHWQYSMHCQAS